MTSEKIAHRLALSVLFSAALVAAGCDDGHLQESGAVESGIDDEKQSSTSDGENTPASTGSSSDGGDDTGNSGGGVCGTTPADMICIPGGLFSMGCNAEPDADGDSNCRDWELPYHEVVLDTFEIDRHEVTVRQYRACVDAGACTPTRTGSSCDYHDDTRGEHPVSCVKWKQAAAYCAWKRRRLPTEAEWERAARGDDGRRYPWGDETISCDFTVMTHGCGKDSSWPVGSKPAGASPYGVLDMVGNIAELVADYWDPDYYKSSPRDNPKGPSEGHNHVIRGGSWDSTLNARNTWLRDRMIAGDSVHQVGFRCAKTP